MATVLQRSAIGACLIAFFVGLLLVDRATGHGWGVLALVGILVGAALREYVLILADVAKVPSTLVLAGVAFVICRGLSHELDPRWGLLQAPVAIGFAYLVFFLSLRGAPSVERFRSLTATAFGFFYVPVLAGYALDIRFLDAEVGPAAFLYLIAIAKGTDICAYFSGKAFGRTKLVPSVSPGKTTAGFVGAVAGGALITALFAWLSPVGRLLPLAVAPGAGVLLALVVISGDLIESFLKRSVEVKDSAKLLPGFGGILDIVDSVMIAAPPVYALFFLLDLRAGAGL
jgi:phosphatidate cytidylyltransferase